MCDSQPCLERLSKERQRLRETTYERYGSEDECEFCGYVHFDDDGNVTTTESCNRAMSIKVKWNDVREARP